MVSHPLSKVTRLSVTDQIYKCQIINCPHNLRRLLNLTSLISVVPSLYKMSTAAAEYSLKCKA